MVEKEQLEKKVLHVYRGELQYFCGEQSIFFYTSPFLIGIGCGGGSSQGFIDTAREAVKKGYKIRVQKTENYKGQQYPLHPEDLRCLQSEFRPDDFINL